MNRRIARIINNPGNFLFIHFIPILKKLIFVRDENRYNYEDDKMVYEFVTRWGNKFMQYCKYGLF